MTTELENQKAMRSTTIVCILKDKKLTMMSDGQVTLGDMIIKSNANKVRLICDNRFAVGFAGSVVDALTLVERIEGKLKEFSYNLERACIEMSRGWRTEKYLKHLKAEIIIANTEKIFSLSGNGDIIEFENGVASVGSGSKFALAASLALYDIKGMSSDEIAEKSMKIAGDFCVYSNRNNSKVTLPHKLPQ